jgi:hypothetical protein
MQVGPGRACSGRLRLTLPRRYGFQLPPRQAAASLIYLCMFTAVLLTPLSASAACSCKCVEDVQRHICDQPGDPEPRCPQMTCPLAPVRIKPSDTHRPPPPGTYSCDHMQVYSPLSARYEWTELCITSSRSSTALLRPGAALHPMPIRSRTASGPACGTDRDCPSGSMCTRRGQNDAWRCERR